MENSLKELFRLRFGCCPQSVELLGASGSNRKYYRMYVPENEVSSSGNPYPEKSLIGVIGTDREENRTFCTLARHFASKGLNVPEIYAMGGDGICYIQQDLGTLSLYDAVSGGRRAASEAFGKRGFRDPEEEGSAYRARIYSHGERELLRKTVRMLPKFQMEGADGLDFSVCHPQSELDCRSIMFDLNYFKYCFLKATGVEFNAVLLENDFEKLSRDILAAGEYAFMYRDFQSRNVMLVDGEPYFIDFQGGMRGPIYYDLASFVWQAKACYPDDLRHELVSEYMGALKEYISVDESVFHRKLSLFVLFRTLQVLGAYGFRGLFEKKQYFIDSIPFALANVSAILPAFAQTYPYLCEVLRNVLASRMAVAREPAAEDNIVKFPGPRSKGWKKEDEDGEKSLEIEICSFSYKKGIPEDRSGNGGGYVFDCRSIHNPGRYQEYKNSTGTDADVIRFLEDDGEVRTYLEHVCGVFDPHIDTYLRRGFTHLMASFGCTGGQHRSVYCAEHLAMHLMDRYASQIAAGKIRILLIHREQNIVKRLPEEAAV